jgi:hypothetical protein
MLIRRHEGFSIQSSLIAIAGVLLVVGGVAALVALSSPSRAATSSGVQKPQLNFESSTFLLGNSSITVHSTQSGNVTTRVTVNSFQAQWIRLFLQDNSIVTNGTTPSLPSDLRLYANLAGNIMQITRLTGGSVSLTIPVFTLQQGVTGISITLSVPNQIATGTYKLVILVDSYNDPTGQLMTYSQSFELNIVVQ